MSLNLVPPSDESIIPLKDIIGKAIRFERISSSGKLIDGEGILTNVTQNGVFISLFNPLVRQNLRGFTLDYGLEIYYSLSGFEPIVRIIESKNTNPYINTVKNVWGEIDGILDTEIKNSY